MAGPTDTPSSLKADILKLTMLSGVYRILRTDIRGMRNPLIAGIACLAMAGPPLSFAEDLNIGPPLKGAWLNPEMPGQGFLVDVMTNPPTLFIGWFTYPRTSEGSPTNPSGHRWYTIQGPFSGPVAETFIYETTGGSFLGLNPSQTRRLGTAAVRFIGCNTAELAFEFDDSGESDVIQITRASSISDAACDSLLPEPPVPEQVDKNTVSVFTNTSVLDMPSGDLIQNQMVVVENGVITRVGEQNPDLIPIGAAIIDGNDRYLVPGMVDMHTHLAVNVRELGGFRISNYQIEQSARNQLVLYLSRGVTTILNNGDFGEPLPRWGEEVDSGQLTGPTIYSAQYARGDSSTSDGGPDNRAVTSAGQARAFTQAAFTDGYQFMKIYEQTPRDAVLAILDEAHSLGMPVIGHLPQTLPAEEALDHGLDAVAHSGSYLWRYFGHDVGSSNKRIAEAVNLSLNNQVAVAATLGIEELIEQIWCSDPQGVSAYWAREETPYMHPTTVRLNERSIAATWRWSPNGCASGGYIGVRNFVRKFTLALHEGGVRVMMGTDSPTVLGLPGFSAIDEVRALVNASIPLEDALRIASWNGGAFISEKLALEVPFGAIREGWRADLVLLASNPLENADNLEDIVGVMAGGRWKSASWFSQQLESIAQSYSD